MKIQTKAIILIVIMAGVVMIAALTDSLIIDRLLPLITYYIGLWIGRKYVVSS